MSKKLLHRVYDDTSQVHHRISDNSYIVRRVEDGADPVEFSTPINLGRLIPAVTWQASEVGGSTVKRLELLQQDEVTYRAATVLGFGYGGAVRVQYEGDSEAMWVDLAKEQYRWLL